MNREGKKLVKGIRKMSKAMGNEDVFHPHYVTVNGLSEKVGHPEYAQQVKNRVWEKMNEDEKYMDYTMIDFNHPDDLCITADGVIAFFDILSGYFDPEALSGVAEYMHTLDEMDKSDMRIKRIERERRQLMEQAPTAMLKGFVAEYKAHGTISGMKMDDETCSLMEAELKSRGPLHFLKQRKGIRMQLFNGLKEDCII